MTKCFKHLMNEELNFSHELILLARTSLVRLSYPLFELQRNVYDRYAHRPEKAFSSSPWFREYNPVEILHLPQLEILNRPATFLQPIRTANWCTPELEILLEFCISGCLSTHIDIRDLHSSPNSACVVTLNTRDGYFLWPDTFLRCNARIYFRKEIKSDWKFPLSTLTAIPIIRILITVAGNIT